MTSYYTLNDFIILEGFDFIVLEGIRRPWSAIWFVKISETPHINSSNFIGKNNKQCKDDKM